MKTTANLWNQKIHPFTARRISLPCVYFLSLKKRSYIFSKCWLLFLGLCLFTVLWNNICCCFPTLNLSHSIKKLVWFGWFVFSWLVLVHFFFFLSMLCTLLLPHIMLGHSIFIFVISCFEHPCVCFLVHWNYISYLVLACLHTLMHIHLVYQTLQLNAIHVLN